MADERVTKSDVLDALHFYKVNADSAVAMTDTATTSSNGLMSAADKVKLDDIESNAQVNVIESVKVNNTALTPSSKAVNIDLSNYVVKDGDKVLSTNDYTTAEKNKLANIPSDATSNVIESVKVNNTALIPSSKAVNIDLSNYVVKDGSKVLSSNDFTTAEKNKLSGIAENANNYVLPTASNSTLGGVKIGSNISISGGTISITKDNVTNALGYTPPTTNTTYSIGDTSAAGLTKLYTSTGTATDGTMTQNAIKSALDGKLGSTAKATSATSADKLSTARNIVTNLASTVPASFNGTASVSAGVTGILPVANGGTGQTNLDDVTVGAAIHDNAGNVISDTYVTKSEFQRKVNAVRLGYRIKKNEADPYARVEYLYDAVGMTPAHMDFDNGVFDYGSWKDVWFVADNKPLMLKSDGTVGYYLNPNDYSKKADGTASDVDNENYDGNAMAQFPLCWIYRYEDNDYLYEIVSNVQYDEGYKAYAHTNASGNIKPYFYNSLFGASGNATKLRSLSDKSLAQDLTMQQQVNGATANGSGWNIGSWSQFSLIQTLIVLIGKSTNPSAVFGYGAAPASASAMPTTGTSNTKGQFFGYTDADHKPVKCFHVEGLWRSQGLRLVGLVNSYGKMYVKMTPEGTGYRVTDTTGYTNTNISISIAFEQYISQMRCTEFGLFPIAASGSSSTYFCAILYSQSKAQLPAIVNGSDPLAFTVYHPPTFASWAQGCMLSYV